MKKGKFRIEDKDKADDLTPDTAEAAVRKLETQALAVTGAGNGALKTLVDNKDDAQAAVNQRASLKEIQKKLKDKKEAITKPLNEALKNVRALFKEVEDDVADAIASIDTALLAYDRKVQQELAAKQERLEAKVARGKIDVEEANEILEKTEDKLGATAIPTREVKTVEVFNEDKVPAEYWVLDMVKVRRDALDGKAIPGVRVVTKSVVYNG